MEFFTKQDFLSKYTDYTDISDVTIMEACEMIYAQVSPRNRSYSWTKDNVPEPVKKASMEQARFLLAYEIPHIDTKKLKAGGMEAELITEYSTLALTILANAGLLYRGSPMTYNMSLDLEWGD